MIRKILCTTISVFFLFGGFILPAVHADTNQSGLVVSPYEENLSLNKGTSVTMTLTLSNSLDIPISVKTTFLDFRAPDDKSGTPDYFVSTEKDNGEVFAHSWFSPIADIVIQPHTYIKQPITLSAPANATPGGHYAGIQFAPSPATQSGNAPGVSLTGKIAVPVIITINGDLKHNLSITSFSIVPSTLQTFSFIDGVTRCVFTAKCELDAHVEFLNAGNVHEAPVGVIELYDVTGTKVISVPFNDKKSLVLPNSSRTFTVPIDPGKISGLKLGRYTAKLVVAYGNNTNISSDTTVFLLDDTYIVLLAFIVLTVGTAYVFRKYNKVHTPHSNM